MYIEDGSLLFILSARKRKRNKTSNYVISLARLSATDPSVDDATVAKHAVAKLRYTRARLV